MRDISENCNKTWLALTILPACSFPAHTYYYSLCRYHKSSRNRNYVETWWPLPRYNLDDLPSRDEVIIKLSLVNGSYTTDLRLNIINLWVAPTNSACYSMTMWSERESNGMVPKSYGTFTKITCSVVIIIISIICYNHS